MRVYVKEKAPAPFPGHAWSAIQNQQARDLLEPKTDAELMDFASDVIAELLHDPYNQQLACLLRDRARPRLLAESRAKDFRDHVNACALCENNPDFYCQVGTRLKGPTT